MNVLSDGKRVELITCGYLGTKNNWTIDINSIIDPEVS